MTRLRNLVLAAALALGCGGVAAQPPAPVTPAFASEEADSGVKAWQVLTAIVYLAVLGGVGFALVRYARRGTAWRGATSGEEAVRAVGSIRLSPTASVTLVDVGGRRVLVTTGPGGTSMIELSRIEAPKND